MSDPSALPVVVAQGVPGSSGDVHGSVVLGCILLPVSLSVGAIAAEAIEAAPTLGPFRVHPGVGFAAALFVGLVLFVRLTRGQQRREGRATLSGRRIRVMKSTGIAVVPLPGLEGYLLRDPICVLLVRRGGIRPDERLSIPTPDRETRTAVLEWLDAAGVVRLD